MTIEVDPGSATIVQVRGYLNRDGSAIQLKIIADWAEAAGLTLAPYACTRV